MLNRSNFSHKEILENYKHIKNRIIASAESVNRNPSEITLVVVTKTYDLESIKPLLDYGHIHFGENRVQEAYNKWSSIIDSYKDLKLHLIGHLQTNKAKIALQLFNVVHSIDSIKLMKEIHKYSHNDNNRCTQLFLEINMANEEQKTGIAVDDLSNFCDYLTNNNILNCDGLMCIPPFDEEPSPYFLLLNKTASQHGFSKLSMGMSADFEKAIQFGATHIRVGSEIFGHRQ
jgi:pyridoxal phosphate enzyme (YggS family)